MWAEHSIIQNPCFAICSLRLLNSFSKYEYFMHFVSLCISISTRNRWQFTCCRTYFVRTSKMVHHNMKTSLRIQLNIYSMKTIDLRPFQNNFAVVLHLENVNDCDNEQSYIKSYTVIWWDLWYFVWSRKKTIYSIGSIPCARNQHVSNDYAF